MPYKHNQGKPADWRREDRRFSTHLSLPNELTTRSHYGYAPRSYDYAAPRRYDYGFAPRYYAGFYGRRWGWRGYGYSGWRGYGYRAGWRGYGYRAGLRGYGTGWRGARVVGFRGGVRAGRR